METYPQLTIEQFNDFSKRCEFLYKIRTKDNQLTGYKPNQPQQYLAKVRQEEFDRTKELTGSEQCKIILLKGRQVGGTTDTAMFNLDVMLRLKMAYGLILAHDKDSTPIIYEKYRLAFLNLPEKIEIINDDGTRILDEHGNPLTIRVKPESESFSGYQLKFDNFPDGTQSTRSRVLVRTAGSGDNVGRGDTLNFCHLSEAASYDYFKDVLSAISQSLPKSSFVYSIIESTANGVSGKGEGFYNLWQKSEKEWGRFERGEIDTFEGYRPVFIPWYRLQEYRRPLVNGQLIDIENIDWHSPENKKEFLELEEKIIEEVFDDRQEGLEAANWYRWCVKENCQYDINRAKREYPTTAEQAFISSDRCFFDTPKLFSVKETYDREGDPEHELGYINDSYEFVPHRFGELKIWEHPVKNFEARYVVSVDPAEGIEDGDFSCIMVFDRLQEKFVAKWYGSMKEDLVAEELLKIAYYYNEALIIPERNLATIIRLIEPEGLMPYTGPIYYQLIGKRPEWGYYTHNNKKDLLVQYNAWLRDDYHKIPDKISLDEHIKFIKEVSNGRAKYHATEGHHDDQVMASALALEGHFWWEDEIFEKEEDNSDIKKIYTSKNLQSKAPKFSKLGKKMQDKKNIMKTRKQSRLGK